MAQAKKCDRCGVFYDRYNESSKEDKTNGFMYLNIDVNQQYYTHKALDLCPACMDGLRNWMKTLKESSVKNK